MAAPTFLTKLLQDAHRDAVFNVERATEEQRLAEVRLESTSRRAVEAGKILREVKEAMRRMGVKP